MILRNISRTIHTVVFCGSVSVDCTSIFQYYCTDTDITWLFPLSIIYLPLPLPLHPALSLCMIFEITNLKITAASHRGQWERILWGSCNKGLFCQILCCDKESVDWLVVWLNINLSIAEAGLFRKNYVNNLISAWISNHIHCRVWTEITCPFKNGATVEFGMDKWFHFIFYWPYHAYDYLSMLGFKLIHVSKGSPDAIPSLAAKATANLAQYYVTNLCPYKAAMCLYKNMIATKRLIRVCHWLCEMGTFLPSLININNLQYFSVKWLWKAQVNIYATELYHKACGVTTDYSIVTTACEKHAANQSWR